jgi:hypothetical protein
MEAGSAPPRLHTVTATPDIVSLESGQETLGVAKACPMGYIY